ncbi:hypothetical protein HZS_3589, partial [Henneguya salminicola]
VRLIAACNTSLIHGQLKAYQMRGHLNKYTRCPFLFDSNGLKNILFSFEWHQRMRSHWDAHLEIFLEAAV